MHPESRCEEQQEEKKMGMPVNPRPKVSPSFLIIIRVSCEKERHVLSFLAVHSVRGLSVRTPHVCLLSVGLRFRGRKIYIIDRMGSTGEFVQLIRMCPSISSRQFVMCVKGEGNNLLSDCAVRFSPNWIVRDTGNPLSCSRESHIHSSRGS